MDDGWCRSAPLPAASKPTLVLDLDFTLVCMNDEGGELDFAMRPGLHQFLSDMAKIYELVLWTNRSQADYAGQVMSKVESQGPLFSYKLSSEDVFGNDLTKDLRKLGRNLNQVVIVDDARDVIASEVIDNAIIIECYDGKGDDKGRLAKLGKVLQALVGSNDFQEKLKELREEGALSEIEQDDDDEDFGMSEDEEEDDEMNEQSEEEDDDEMEEKE